MAEKPTYKELEQRVKELEIESTERKRIEQSLQLTQFAIDHFSDAAFWMGPDARFVYVNEAACRALGYSREELLTMTVHDIDPDFPEEVWPEHWAELRRRGSFVLQSHHRTKDGRIFSVEISVNYVDFGGKELNCAFARDITERKQAEEAMRESEERFRRIVTGSDAGYFFVDRNGQWKDVNDAWLKMHGYSSREEVIGKHFSLTQVDEDMKEAQRNVERLLNGEPIPAGEFSRRCKDGSIAYHTFSASPVIRGGDIVGLEGFIIDITERKKSEEALRQSKERFSSMVANIPGAVYRCLNDTHWTMLFISEAIESISGYPASDFLQNRVRTYASIIHPDDRQIVERNVQQAVSSAAPFTLEYRVVDVDGKEHWVYERGQGIREKNGEVKYLDGAIFDITDRKEAEHALRESEENARALLNGLDDVAALADGKGIILDANEAFAQRFGRHVSEVVGVNVGDLMPPDVAQRRKSYFDEVVQSGKPVRFEDERQGVWFDNIFYPVLDEHEKVGKVAVLARDITERKRAEDSLRESEIRFRTLSAATFEGIVFTEQGIIADVNQQLAHILGYELKEMPGMNVSELVAPEDRELVRSRILEGSEEPYEHRSIRKDGTIIFTEVRPRMMSIEGQPRRVTAVRDVTERKRAEEELQRAFAEIKELKEQLEAENVYLREEIRVRHGHEEIIGKSDAIKDVLSQTEQVAETNSTVLLLGDTGTGKELLAEAIHRLGSRKKSPMVKVNCAALPSTLVESELFGREKGAYTGALSRQVGRFEIANGSTIFLDEISELPLDLQSKLLRVLQEGEFERLGSSKTIHVDVRVIAATNRDLAKAVQEGRFRQDLYYRLNVFPITVPPLRDRREDIPLLVWAFVKEFGETMGKAIERIPRKSMEALQRYPWPGNVRELRNVIERAMILTTGSTLGVELPRIAGSPTYERMTLEQVEREYINDVLQRTGWRVRGENGAAEIVGLKPTTLEARMKKLGIRRSSQISNIL